MKTIPDEELIKETMKMLADKKKEQDHERTLRTMRTAFVLIVVLTALLAALGCNAKSPTSFDDDSPQHHPNETLVYQLTQCYGRHLGITQEISVVFSDELRWVPCGFGTGMGPNGQCAAAGWAWPMNMVNGRTKVTYYHPWILDRCYPETCAQPTKPEHINDRAAHEVCHVNNNYTEDEANACAAVVLREAGCF